MVCVAVRTSILSILLIQIPFTSLVLFGQNFNPSLDKLYRNYREDLNLLHPSDHYFIGFRPTAFDATMTMDPSSARTGQLLKPFLEQKNYASARFSLVGLREKQQPVQFMGDNDHIVARSTLFQGTHSLGDLRWKGETNDLSQKLPKPRLKTVIKEATHYLRQGLQFAKEHPPRPQYENTFFLST